MSVNQRTIFLVVVGCLTSAAQAHAAPGTYWAVKMTMEMEGMPFAMPEVNQNLCIAGDVGDDPVRSVPDADCQVTDVKKSGNKASWKMRCKKDGDEMTGEGEMTWTADSYSGTMHMTSSARGEKMEMTQHVNGTKTGGSCDTAEVERKRSQEAAKAQAMADQYKAMAQASQREMCNTDRPEGGAALVSSAMLFFGPDAMCADQAKDACKRIRKDARKDPNTYEALVNARKNPAITGNVNVIKECDVDMKEAKADVCRNNADGDIGFLDRTCPAEAKAAHEREMAQRAYTAQRSFTASDDKKKEGKSIKDNLNKLKGLFNR